MRVIIDLKEMQKYSKAAKGQKIGLVPTMGYLHAGHLSLVEAARKSSDRVVVSIFVNPIQFGPKEDFKKYPRDLKRDKKLLKPYRPDVIFIPKVEEIFPNGFSTFIEVKDLSDKLCGKIRPGHFKGVTTIVLKLFEIVQPDLAFFGEKDFQQQVIIKKMVKDLNLPVKIVALPTVREEDGLALSSRNTYLKPKERQAAPVLYKSLLLAEEMVNCGEKNSQKIMQEMRKLIGSEPLIKIDYISICDPETFKEVKAVKGKTLVALAAYVGKARLIDNLLLTGK